MTLCAEDILYLPVTTEISSLPQLTPEGLPLALARRAAEVTRMVNAVAKLEERGEVVTARTVAAAARISLNTACTWLRQQERGTMESAAALSTLQYSTHSIPDNITTVENSTDTEVPEGTSAAVIPPTTTPALECVPLTPTLPAICAAASHQLLWCWHAGIWQCPACGG